MAHPIRFAKMIRNVLDSMWPDWSNRFCRKLVTAKTKATSEVNDWGAIEAWAETRVWLEEPTLANIPFVAFGGNFWKDDDSVLGDLTISHEITQIQNLPKRLQHLRDLSYSLIATKITNQSGGSKYPIVCQHQVGDMRRNEGALIHIHPYLDPINELNPIKVDVRSVSNGHEVAIKEDIPRIC